MKNILLLSIVMLVLPHFYDPVYAGTAQETGSAAKDANLVNKSTPISSITVAIIDFESSSPGNPDMGKQIGDVLTARLSIYDQYRLVERQKLHDLLKEHELNLTGMVDTDQAVKAGKLLGARIMIFGRAFPVDKELYIAAKIVGTETSQVKGVIANGKLEGNLSDIINKLVEKLSDGLEKWDQICCPRKKNFKTRYKS